MKKTMFLLASTALLLAACGNDEKEVEQENVAEKAIDVKVEESSNAKEESVNKAKEKSAIEDNKTEDKVATEMQLNSKEKVIIAQSLIKAYFDGIKEHDLTAVNKVAPTSLEDNENTVMFFKGTDLIVTIGEVTLSQAVGNFGYYQVNVKFESAKEDINFDANESLYEFVIDDDQKTILQKSILNSEYFD